VNVKDFTAINGVCAWPSLQKNTNNELNVFIFNQPCHSFWEGDIECWKSSDAGDSWLLHSRVTEHAPSTNRMNIATGYGHKGELIVIVGGWDQRKPAGTTTDCDWQHVNANAHRLQPWIRRSADGGKNWRMEGTFPSLPGLEEKYKILTPFGRIIRSGHNRLSVSAYAHTPEGLSTYFLNSVDNGLSWETRMLNPTGNETSLFQLENKKWLAASREKDMHVELFISNDDGNTWERKMPLTLPRQAPGDFFQRLEDKRIFYIYGNRCKGNYGLDIRSSDDQGMTWSAPERIIDIANKDSGYPSCVMVSDADVVTAYYTKLDGDFEYEMRIVKWKLSQL
jgi:hypothetical protein